MKLICAPYENPDVQCCVVEKGKRCNHGSRVVERALCNKHYARWQRTGSFDRLTKAEVARERKEMRRIEEGLSIVCFCTHTFADHRYDQYGSCKVHGCFCREFDGTNANAMSKVVRKMHKMGFHPINKSVYCKHCGDLFHLGHWSDVMIFIRIREHLKTHLKAREKITAFRPSG